MKALISKSLYTKFEKDSEYGCGVITRGAGSNGSGKVLLMDVAHSQIPLSAPTKTLIFFPFGAEWTSELHFLTTLYW
jgi:hypothetical protein